LYLAMACLNDDLDVFDLIENDFPRQIYDVLGLYVNIFYY